MFILILASLIVAIGFLVAFIWSVKNGQFEDDYTPSVRMLFDDGVTKSDNLNSIEAKQEKNNKTNNYGTRKI